MSKVGKLCDVLAGSNYLGDTALDNLASYHAAKLAINYARSKSPWKRFNGIREALRCHRVVITQTDDGKVHVNNPATVKRISL
jgi:hypothetical protein